MDKQQQAIESHDWEMRSSCPRCHSEVVINKDGIVFRYDCNTDDRGIDRRQFPQKDQPKGGCPKCKGGGILAFAPDAGDLRTCPPLPDGCNGTGERRRQHPITLEFAGKRIYYLDPCMTAYTDRRTKEERRQ